MAMSKVKDMTYVLAHKGTSDITYCKNQAGDWTTHIEDAYEGSGPESFSAAMKQNFADSIGVDVTDLKVVSFEKFEALSSKKKKMTRGDWYELAAGACRINDDVYGDMKVTFQELADRAGISVADVEEHKYELMTFMRSFDNIDNVGEANGGIFFSKKKMWYEGCNESVEKEFATAICKANKLNPKKIGEYGSDEYWIYKSLVNLQDIDDVYSAYVEHCGNKKLISEFKKRFMASEALDREPGWSKGKRAALGPEKDPCDKYIKKYIGQSIWNFFDDVVEYLRYKEAKTKVPARYRDAFDDYCAYYGIEEAMLREEEMNEVEKLFAKMAKDDTYATKLIAQGQGVMFHDQYGTMILYDDNELKFIYGSAEDEDALLFGTAISAMAPITMYEDDGVLHINVPNCAPAKAVEIVKAICEV